MQAAFDRNFRFEPGKDFTPLAQIVASNYVLTVRNDLPPKTIAEFIAFAKQARPSLTFGSPTWVASTFIRPSSKSTNLFRSCS